MNQPCFWPAADRDCYLRPNCLKSVGMKVIKLYSYPLGLPVEAEAIAERGESRRNQNGTPPVKRR